MPIICAVQELSESPRRSARLYYQSDHALADIMSTGYFTPAAQSLRPHDIIEVWAEWNARPVFEELVVVAVSAVERGVPQVVVKPLSDFRAREPKSSNQSRRPSRSTKGK